MAAGAGAVGAAVDVARPATGPTVLSIPGGRGWPSAPRGAEVEAGVPGTQGAGDVSPPLVRNAEICSKLPVAATLFRIEAKMPRAPLVDPLVGTKVFGKGSGNCGAGRAAGPMTGPESESLSSESRRPFLLPKSPPSAAPNVEI